MTEVTPEKLNEFIRALEKSKIRYMVIAGFGLDGKRGFLSRPHQDLDTLCMKRDLPKIERVIKKLGYSGQRFNDLYKLQAYDGSKVDLGLLSIEGDEVVIYGRIAITRFPKKLFEIPQKGHIENFEFDIASNELLKLWGSQSRNKNDSIYANTLPVDEEIVKKLKRVLIKEV